jgi:hypothetical protein
MPLTYRAAYIPASQPSRIQGAHVAYGPVRQGVAEAGRDAKELVRSGKACFAVVVEDRDGVQTPLADQVHPDSLRETVYRWEQIWSAAEGPRQGSPPAHR